MNEIIDNFLLSGDKLMPEMHLKKLGLTYSACGQSTKNKEDIFIKTNCKRSVFNMIWLM